ncbi:filamin-A-like [Babylonia areolata]|uniref:filamin-A-like n=1 Tax=Babylonia areolata TaxID=304850 RepID=UPI003FCFD69C
MCAVDQSVAGEGMLRGEVKNLGSAVPCEMRECGEGRWELVFTPLHVGTHTVHLSLGGVPLPGSPFHVDVIDCGGICVSGEGLYSARVNTKTFFSLDLHGLDATDVDISITDPSGNRLRYGVGRRGHIFRVEVVPVVVGPHRVQVLLAGGHIHGSPFVCHAYDPARVTITHVDRSARRGKEIGFTVDTSAAGCGDLDIDISHEGQKVKTGQKEVGDGRYRYAFLPGETGQFEVRATFNGDNIPGCPLLVRVEEDTPTFITISYLSTEPINIRGARTNFFVLHMGGTHIDATRISINIEGGLTHCMWGGGAVWCGAARTALQRILSV